MKREYNSQSFTPEGVEKGLHLEFLKSLLDLNTKLTDRYNDIHITNDSYCTIIEWDCVPHDHAYGGEWKYITEDNVVMTEVNFPDGHFDYVFPEDVEETLNEWHKKHPEWVMTPYGTWTNEEENKKFKEELEKSKK